MKDDVFCTQIESVKKQLYYIALSYTKDEIAAVDMVDEAVYQAYINKNKLRNEEYFKTWITRILINLCKKRYMKIKQFESFDELSDTDSYSIDIDSIELKNAIDSLPVKLRDVIVMRWLMDYTLEETARVLGKPKTTIHSQAKKALQILRIRLED